jgi:hypothetical protein
VSPLPHFPQPQASWILFVSNPPEHGTGAVDQQGAQIAIAEFTNAGQWGSASARPLFGNKPKPGSKLTSILERASVADRGD